MHTPIPDLFSPASLLTGVVLLVLATTVSAQHPAAAERPNVVYILADDLGYGDLGCYGQKRIKTPVIDRLAAEGLRFTDHYAGSTVCAPSRCVLMTGLHTGHCQIRNNQEVQPMGQAPLRAGTATVARLMQQAGYATALIGKWGLGGPGSAGVPNQQGFDEFYGYLCQRHAHNCYPEFLFRNDKRVPLLGNKLASPSVDGSGVAVERGEYVPALCADEALRFIERNKERPFFLCYTTTLPHANNEAGNKGMEVPSLGEYAALDWPEPQKGHAAMISRLDADVGRLLGKLKELGLDGKTIVFFTSDNGPHGEGGCDPDFNDSNGPLRGMKRDLHDGGIRVPLVVRWPGTIRPGATTGLVSAGWDFLPTVCEAAGLQPPANIDGISYLPTLVGDDARQRKHESLYWEYAGAMAVRAGRWKALGNPGGNRLELYDIEADPGESKNLAADNPLIVERMKKIMVAAHLDPVQPIDLGSLLEDMLDRTGIVEFPQPEFTCRQASSYNRRSKTPGNPDWFAGCDFDQFHGSVEIGGRKEWIMLDADGPGVVTRWWLTQFNNAGTIRIYLDGAAEPLVAGQGKTLVGGVDGGILTGPPLATIVSGGRNLYLPIPFSAHCRITFESPKADADFTKAAPSFANESLFYNINYLQYPAGTAVKSLTLADLEANRGLIAKVGQELLQPENHTLPIRRKVAGGSETLKPGASLTRKISGSGAIAVLRLKLGASDLPQAMRSTILIASFDGKQTVAAPVGEFFGSGPGLNPFKDWWRMVDKDGWMTCWWPMPFRESAVVGVTNHGTGGPVEVELADIGIADWQWTDRTMVFHTAWRGDNLIRFGSNNDPQYINDWNYVTIAGKGVYVGDSLSLYNRPARGGGLGPWWGEGDEKIFVDGEAFPSHFGTGSEDYYGYAFNGGSPFSTPFHCQPMAQGNSGVGHTTNERVRIHDRIPFKSGFKFDMELYHWQPDTRNDYATTTHWYALGGTTDNGQATPVKLREKLAQPWTGSAEVSSPGKD